MTGKQQANVFIYPYPTICNRAVPGHHFLGGFKLGGTAVK